MKQLLFGILALCSFLGGVLGAIIYMVYATVLSIYTIIQMCNGNEEVTFWSIFVLTCLWICRESVCALIVILFWFFGFTCLAITRE